VDRSRALHYLGLLGAFLLLATLAPAHAGSAPPRHLPRSALVAPGLLEERSKAGVLLHAQWMDDDGAPKKYFKGTKRFPWPKPLPLAAGQVVLRFDGVRYPGTVEVGIFKRTGISASPMGAHALYTCSFPGQQDGACRWVPTVVGGEQQWEVRIDHPQSSGHLYIVAVGQWEDPRDPPHPVGTRSQVQTWIYHGRIAR
jgi:hypothetical protein